MSPKGGIKPHKRFSIDAKRSEVLFVDYMAEHLSANGRAGIIVPEGIIFQSQTAYKALRKMLVDEALVAVVSLPAGCFNPDSGVKTSILILDKSIAKQSDSIAFFKVVNDGFGLGAQRRAIEKNDLPQVQADLATYLRALRAKAPTDTLSISTGLIVPKDKIAANGEYNLSGERYREGAVAISSWPFVLVGDVFRKADQTVLPESLQGPVTYLGLENITQNTGEIEGNVVTEKPTDIKSLKNIFKPGDILYGKLRPNLNKVFLADRKGICSTDIFVLEAIDGAAAPALYAYLFRNARFNDAVMGQLKGAQLPRIGWSSFAELKIPLPPLDVQKEIVAEIDGYQKVIDGARAVLENYRPHIPIHPGWPIRNLGSLAVNLDSRRVPITKGDRKEGSFPYYGASGIVDSVADFIFDEDILLVSEDGANLLARSTPIAFSVSGKCWVNNHAHVLKFPEAATQKFVEVYLNSIPIEEFVTGAAQPKLNQEALNRIQIPIPSDLATQQAIVVEIEAEQALVAANRELITRFEQKIQAALARIWGEESSVPPEL